MVPSTVTSNKSTQTKEKATKKNTKLILTAVAATALLSACGGGGGGTATAPVATTAPVASAPFSSVYLPLQTTVPAPPYAAGTREPFCSIRSLMDLRQAGNLWRLCLRFLALSYRQMQAAATSSASIPTVAGVSCPTQVAPEMPRQAIVDKVEGVVRAKATIFKGAVTDVKILSGPEIFHESVVTAMKQHKCSYSETAIEATQEFNFKVEPQPSTALPSTKTP